MCVASAEVGRQIGLMGKRSGVPHRDDELAGLSRAQLEAELARARVRLSVPNSAKMTKVAQKQVYWLESALASRD
jgi:hypothetical protein